MKSPLFLFLLMPVSAYSAPDASFDGCKGLTVTRSRDFSQVDVSADLKKAEKRIGELCGKVIPKKQKAIDASAKSCLAGAAFDTGSGIAGQVTSQTQSQMYAFDRRVKEACESMKKTMEDSKRACGVRQSTLSSLNKGISTIEKAESDQTASLKNVAALYGGAVSAYGETAKAAGEAKEKIYAKLPDRDENRAQQMRTGQESASTADPKTDRLIADWKATISSMAKGNKKKSACLKLAANGGQLDEMAGILKNNLWPNGKVAARAMSRIESADKEKAAEFASKKSVASERVSAAEAVDLQDKTEVKKSDVTGTPEEGLVKQTPEQLGDLHAKANKAAELQQETFEICKQQGGCKDQAALSAALKMAQDSEAGPKEPVNYPVQQALRSSVLGDTTVVDKPGILDDIERTPASAIGQDTYKAPEIPCITSVWGWWPPGYTERVGVKNAAGDCVVN